MANAREQAYFEFSTEEKEGETRVLEEKRREEREVPPEDKRQGGNFRGKMFGS